MGVVFIVLTGFSEICFPQDELIEHTPFDQYIRINNKIFAYDKNLFTPYSGPDVSHWKLEVSHPANNSDEQIHEYDRKRLGIFALTPSLQVYLDEYNDPISKYYELRETKNGNLIHVFKYQGGADGALLFNGAGSVYQYASPEYGCFGKETKKFILEGSKLVEVRQPMSYWEESNTTTIVDVILFLEPTAKSSQVASLPKNTHVKVLTENTNGWLLIKTPLGLTGWVEFYKQIKQKVGDKEFDDSQQVLDIPICG